MDNKYLYLLTLSLIFVLVRVIEILNELIVGKLKVEQFLQLMCAIFQLTNPFHALDIFRLYI